MTFTENEQGKIIIEGVIGDGFYSDIAIDDIEINQCVSAPQGSVERAGLCRTLILGRTTRGG